MIDISLKFLQDYLVSQMVPPPNNPVVLGNITKDADIVNNKIHLSLIHIEEERVMRDMITRKKINPTDNFYTKVNPEIRLNLYVLVTYQYNSGNNTYEEALKQISRVIMAFQAQSVFTKADFTKPIYDPLKQIVLELYTQSLSESSNLWQAMGDKLSPAVIYKVKVVALQANRAIETVGEVQAIGIDLHQKAIEDQL